MHYKAKQHFDFFSSLTYYDASEFMIASNQWSPFKNQSSQDQISKNQFEISEIFSMEHLKEFNRIKEFIEEEEECLPLLIKSEPNKGKKALICQIINHYQKHSGKTKLFIPNFACVNKIYSEILYNIMVKLRVNNLILQITFGINQKVEVNEEKIRRFFKYWLDVTSEQIEKNNLGYTKAEKQTLCIIIDGVDELTNIRGQKVFPQFWLPQHLPKNVKLILSGTSGVDSIQKLQEQSRVKLINLTSRVFSQKQKNKLNPQICKILNRRQNLSLFHIKTLTWFLNMQSEMKLSEEQQFSKIVESYIRLCSQSLKESVIKSLLYCLSLSKKGLTEKETQKIMGLKHESIAEFLFMFKPLIDCYQNYYLIANPEVRTLVQQISDPNFQKQQKYHEIIAKVLKKSEISIRKLEEEIYHLDKAEKHFQIKEVVTDVENFLLLYTPPCKYLLCNTWKSLELNLNSDPVFQYNKAIESFLTHYHPKEEQLFKITFQLSMFLREYSEFEGAKIPYFKHPLIKGDEEQLQQICVYEELKKHKMTSDMKASLKKNVDFQSKGDKEKRKNFQSSLKKSISQFANTGFQMETPFSKIDDSSQESSKSFSIEEIQCLNLQIQQKKQKFKEHYLKILKPYLKEHYVPTKKLMNNDKFVKSSNSSEDDEQLQEVPGQMSECLTKDLPEQLEKIKSSMILKNLDEYFEETCHREEIIKFYYYKEWIWIQFPWICQSLNYSFSDMIQNYIANPTSYMSMETEANLIKEVMKISQVSKENKLAIFQQKKIDIISINPSKLKKVRATKLKRNRVNQSVNNLNLKKKSFAPTKRNFESPNNKSLRCANEKQSQSHLNRSNLAKFELKFQALDEKLDFELKKQMSNRCAFDSRVLMKSQLKANNINSNSRLVQPTLFLTQTSNKENSTILPRISLSKLDENRTPDQLPPRMIQQLNKITNQNKQLKHMIEKIQKTSLMIQSIDSVSEELNNKKKIQQFTNLKIKLEKKQEFQSRLKQKLQAIIKICDNNKSHQKESQLLSTFLENLKCMSSLEENKKQAQAKDFIAFVERTKQQINELLAVKSGLLNQLKGIKPARILTEKILDEEQSESVAQNVQLNSCLKNKEEKTTINKKQRQVKIQTSSDTSEIKLHQTQNKAKINLHYCEKRSTHKDKNTKHQNLMPNSLNSIFSFDPSNYSQSINTFQTMIDNFQQKVVKFKQLKFFCQELNYEGSCLKDKIANLEKELKTITERNEVLAQTKINSRPAEPSGKQLRERNLHLEMIKQRTKLLEEFIKKYSCQN